MSDLENIYLKHNNICPWCNVAIQPIVNNFSIDAASLYTILECPKCHQYYFEILQDSGRLGYYGQEVFESISVFPNPTLDIPTDIETYYPDFYRIYEEAARAESLNLNEICGMGYRKALEYLVKHYAIERNEELKDDIAQEKLIQTIKRLDTRLATLATAAAWLGNDQTHIVKKHPDHDLAQLKAFIAALCQFILSEKEFEKAHKLIASKGEKPKPAITSTNVEEKAVSGLDILAGIADSPVRKN